MKKQWKFNRFHGFFEKPVYWTKIQLTNKIRRAIKKKTINVKNIVDKTNAIQIFPVNINDDENYWAAWHTQTALLYLSSS